MNLRDATTTPVFWSTDRSDSIRPSVLGGVAFTRPLGPGTATASFGSRLGGDAADESGANPLNAGFEYVRGKIALRTGLEEGRQAFGVGLAPHDRLELDLAYQDHDELKSTYQVSLGFRY